jgi:hypothetical protein
MGVLVVSKITHDLYRLVQRTQSQFASGACCDNGFRAGVVCALLLSVDGLVSRGRALLY